METLKIHEIEVTVKDLEAMFTSQSIWTLLRYGVECPSTSGMDECEDTNYIALYDLVNTIQQNVRNNNDSK